MKLKIKNRRSVANIVKSYTPMYILIGIFSVIFFFLIKDSPDGRYKTGLIFSLILGTAAWSALMARDIIRSLNINSEEG